MIKRTLMGAALLMLASSPAYASAIVPDGSWHEFLFGAATSAVTGCGGCVPTTNPVAEAISAPPWTWTGPATLTILDLFSVGDRFQAFDNAVSVGSTSVVANTGVNVCDNNIGCALANAAYSRLVIDFGAGSHSLTMNVIQNALGSSGGAATFRLAAVPEPATLMLLGTGVLALARRRLARKR